jgi:hypothetical protein
VSQTAISNALETRLDALTPTLLTAWENVNFISTADAYQSVTVLFAKPENPVFGDNFNRQRGMMIVELVYPLGSGRKDALARAELTKNWFPRGLSLTDDGVTTVIEETPEIAKGGVASDKYVIYVKIRFFANLEG